MSIHNQLLGKWGEDTALSYLVNLNYELISRNVRNEIGEIDLVMKIEEIVVFIEVKTRTTIDYGFPEEAITASKYQRMFDCASLYISENLQDFNGDWRIDLVSIIGEYQSKYPEIIHLDQL